MRTKLHEGPRQQGLLLCVAILIRQHTTSWSNTHLEHAPPATAFSSFALSIIVRGLRVGHPCDAFRVVGLVSEETQERSAGEDRCRSAKGQHVPVRKFEKLRGQRSRWVASEQGIVLAFRSRGTVIFLQEV